MTTSYVTFSMEVTEEEKKAALRVRELFSEFLGHLDDFQEFFQIFFESIDLVDDSKKLLSILPEIKRYQIKLRELFNNLIRALGSAIHECSQNFSDTKTGSMQEIVVENMGAARADFIELMQAMDQLDSEDFLENGKELYDQINKYLEKIQETISGEWFGHIDQDILGKIKLSSPTLPLFFRKGNK